MQQVSNCPFKVSALNSKTLYCKIILGCVLFFLYSYDDCSSMMSEEKAPAAHWSRSLDSGSSVQRTKLCGRNTAENKLEMDTASQTQGGQFDRI